MPRCVTAVNSVVFVGVLHEFKLLICLNQCLTKNHRILRVNIVVATAENQQKLTFQLVGIFQRRIVDLALVIVLRQTHITLGVNVVIILPIRYRRNRNAEFVTSRTACHNV